MFILVLELPLTNCTKSTNEEFVWLFWNKVYSNFKSTKLFVEWASQRPQFFEKYVSDFSIRRLLKLLIFKAKIFKILLNEMVAVDVLETSEDFEDDTEDEDDEEEDGTNFDEGIGGNGPAVELSKLLEVSAKRGVFDEEENDFEDPDARFVISSRSLYNIWR